MENKQKPGIPFACIAIEKTRSSLSTDMAEMHVHPFYELYFLLSGERRYFIGGDIYHVAPGNLVIIPKNVLHKTGALNKKGYDRYVIYFTEEVVKEFISLIGRESFDRFSNMGCLQFPAEQIIGLREKMERLAAEESKRDNLTLSLQQSLVVDIIISVLRYGKKKQCAASDGADKIQLVAKHISENYASHIDLKSAAEMACMERTYFSKRFKALTGFGFSSYLTRTRLQASVALLESTNMSISQISDACGFSGSNYFGDVFTKQYGISPKEYKKRAVESN